jgi:hypothetical protein
MINVVKRETAGALISQDWHTLGATMISHTPGFFHLQYQKSRKFD